MNENTTQETQPEFFYKYMTADIAKIVLTERTLRWSTYKILNDPMDLQVQFGVFEGDVEKAKELFLEKSWDIFSQRQEMPRNKIGVVLKILYSLDTKMTRKEFNDNLAMVFDEACATFQHTIKKFNEEYLAACTDCKVLCFCEDPCNTVMWGNYAESHTGVVMAFGNVSGIDSPYKLAESVRYSKTMPNLYDEESLSDLMSGRTDLSSPNHTKRIMKAFALTKDAKWSFEKEWRIVLWGGGLPNAAFEDAHFDGRELQKIIFGYKMLADKRNELRKIAANLYPHVEFYEATFKDHAGVFDMEIHNN